MDAEFWHQKWAEQDIGFDQSKPNKHLIQFHSKLALKTDAHVFVPLCGKTIDIAWLLEQGHRVSGVELSETAVKELFDNLSLQPSITETGSLKKYHADHLTVYVGDLFDLTQVMLGSIEATYDRAALVALPPEMRIRYTQHLRLITESAQQLLLTFNYDQEAMAGPPHSIPPDEVNEHYASHYTIDALASLAVPNGLKGKVDANEMVWHLHNG